MINFIEEDNDDDNRNSCDLVNSDGDNFDANFLTNIWRHLNMPQQNIECIKSSLRIDDSVRDTTLFYILNILVINT